MHEDAGWPGQFDAAFRAWVERPLDTPPDLAAARVRARLRQRSTAEVFPGLALRVAASITVALTIGVGLRVLWSPPPARLAVGAADVPAPPLPANVMVFWLDPETPVYFVTHPETSQEIRP
jgi:hypothetical protein